MSNPPAPPGSSILAPPVTMNVTRIPDPPPPPPSLVQRIAALEDQLTRVFAMMDRDREYMDQLRTRIGLTP